MLKSKIENKIISFIMGTDETIKDKLDSIGATYTIEEDKYYLTMIPVEKVNEYENIITEYLKPGFWNEYIGEEVVFIFKTPANDTIRYILNSSTEEQILKLCNEYANFKKTSVIDMILDEPFYKENTVGF